jgi:hypothetical protein
MNVKKIDNGTKITEFIFYSLLIISTSFLIQQEYSNNGIMDPSLFAVFWFNHLLFITSLFVLKKQAPFRKLFYLRLPQICSAGLGILINTSFIIQGKINEAGLIYIMPLLWPLYVGFFLLHLSGCIRHLFF